MAQNIVQNIVQNMSEKTNSLDRSLTLPAVKKYIGIHFWLAVKDTQPEILTLN